ncbi:hypothetical protein KSS87_011076 [Heliosperma pusillum]|nr:hypothetical protein KSS87_011076 [Heliosperma pusillum]KAH9622309.1 hypothetical protein KSS87_011076 [Heliosperma pusillum]
MRLFGPVPTILEPARFSRSGGSPGAIISDFLCFLDANSISYHQVFSFSSYHLHMLILLLSYGPRRSSPCLYMFGVILSITNFSPQS